MKKIIISFIFTLLTFAGFASNEDIINNIITQNNNIYELISTLDENKQNEFYEELFNTKTNDEFTITIKKYFGDGEQSSNFIYNIKELGSNVNEFSKSPTHFNDYLNYTNKPTEEDKDAAPCKCRPCYERCWAQTADAIQAGYWNSLSGFLSNGAGAGAGVGTILGGIIGDQAGAIAGATIGTMIGTLGGFIQSLENYRSLSSKGKLNCHQIHCLGLDTGGPISGGGPGGGFNNNNKFKRIN